MEFPAIKEKRRKVRPSSGVLIKVILLGDSGVGKTSLLQRYVGGFYLDSLTPTIGIDFKIKTLTYNGIKVNLQIWDTAGQQKFKTLTKAYFQGCMGVIFAFSLTDRTSFKNTEKWISQLDDHIDSQPIRMLVGSKIDCMDQRAVEIEQCADLALKYEMQYYETSAKTGYNVNSIFESMVERHFAEKSKYYSDFIPPKSLKLINPQEQKKNCEC